MNQESSCCKPTRHWWPRRLGIVTRGGRDFIICLHHMVIIRNQNKITDFLMILAWASPFKWPYWPKSEVKQTFYLLTLQLLATQI